MPCGCTWTTVDGRRGHQVEAAILRESTLDVDGAAKRHGSNDLLKRRTITIPLHRARAAFRSRAARWWNARAAGAEGTVGPHIPFVSAWNHRFLAASDWNTRAHF